MKALTPADGMKTIRQEMDRLFDRFWETGPFAVAQSDWFPQMDMDETSDSVVATMDVPGMDAKDIHVTVRNDVLTIRGEKKVETEIKNAKRYRSERSYGAFVRSIPLPVPVNADAVKAEVRNGVLTVTLPKTAQAKDLEVPVLAG